MRNQRLLREIPFQTPEREELMGSWWKENCRNTGQFRMNIQAIEIRVKAFLDSQEIQQVLSCGCSREKAKQFGFFKGGQRDDIGFLGPASTGGIGNDYQLGFGYCDASGDFVASF